MEANATPDTMDIIAFDGNVFLAGVLTTITVTNGSLDITSLVRINGLGPEAVQVAGAMEASIFTVAAGKVAEVTGLKVANGTAGAGDGGAMKNAGSITLDWCYFTNNVGTKGGAIANLAGARATIGNSTFKGNRTPTGEAASGEGGAMYSGVGCVITISATRFEDNQAKKGGALASNTATTQLLGVTLTGNLATITGGAIYMSQGTIEMTGGSIDNNEAQGSAGGGGVNLSWGGQGAAGTATFRQVEFRDNKASSPANDGNGGAIMVAGFNLTIDTCTFGGNTATGKGANIAYRGRLAGVDPGEPNVWITIYDSPTTGAPVKVGD